MTNKFYCNNNNAIRILLIRQTNRDVSIHQCLIKFIYLFQSLKETILLCCEAFCKCLAADGYFMHVDVACKLYGYLAKLDCSLPDDDYAGQSYKLLRDDIVPQCSVLYYVIFTCPLLHGRR